MFAIAFVGVIMHELTACQVQSLVDAAKKRSGKNSLLVCNASGLFAQAPRLSAQLEMLFDSGIDLVFAGEQSVARNSGRSELGSGQRQILRPLNMGKEAPGVGAKLVNLDGEKVWMLCLADQSNKTPVEHAHEALESFFRNKSDHFPVFINVNGKDADYKKALAWKYSNCGCSVAVVGSGLNFCSGIPCMDGNGGAFQADGGIVCSRDAVAGIEPSVWWKRHVERLPVAIVPGNAQIEADITLFFYEKGSVRKTANEKLVLS